MNKIVILDQSKPISLYLKIKKLKNPKFINCMFIICKNGNKTIILQPILKSNATSFIFNNIFCEIKSKMLSTGGGRGRGWSNVGTLLISSWEV